MCEKRAMVLSCAAKIEKSAEQQVSLIVGLLSAYIAAHVRLATVAFSAPFLH
jgi:hypothetical protein